MEDNRKVAERGLRRLFERNRLEEQLWAMAYEQIWPGVQRSGSQRVDRLPRSQQLNENRVVARRA